MPRWATHLFIAGYLGALAFGLVAHTMTYLKSSHPAMYFVVWDMFCGWSAYENRMHIVGEGDSGAHYLLSEAPWGEFIPYGSARRHDYDLTGRFCYRIGMNTLNHTDHEPIRRLLVVEESWPKKFNLPPHLWERRYQSAKPEVLSSYFHVRSSYNPAGECLSQRRDWVSTQCEFCLLDNPRLRAGMRKGQTQYVATPAATSANTIQPVAYETETP